MSPKCYGQTDVDEMANDIEENKITVTRQSTTIELKKPSDITGYL